MIRHLRPLIASLLLTSLILAACMSTDHPIAPGTLPPSEELVIRVMSFNIRYGTADDGLNSWPWRRPRVAQKIRSFSPDFLALQEALTFQLDHLAEDLPSYGQIGVGRDDGRTAGEYAAILYRADRWTVDQSGTFWLSDTPDIPGSRTWGNTLPRICTWARLIDRRSGHAVYFYNTHLDHASDSARHHSARLIMQQLAHRRWPDPVILAGDFNMSEDHPAILYLQGRSDPVPLPLIDSFRRLHPHATNTATFHAFSAKTHGPRIDYIFCDPTFTILQADILRDPPGSPPASDHFPVIAVLKLPLTESTLPSAP